MPVKRANGLALDRGASLGDIGLGLLLLGRGRIEVRSRDHAGIEQLLLTCEICARKITLRFECR